MFEGRQLAEYHEHVYDDAGRLAKTVIYREVEWTEEDRARALALQEWEAGFCQCGCGQRIEVAYNPTQAFLVHKGKCQARVVMERQKRQDREKAELASHDGKLPDDWNDGVRYYVEPVETPEEVKKSRVERARKSRRQAREKVTTG